MTVALGLALLGIGRASSRSAPGPASLSPSSSGSAAATSAAVATEPMAAVVSAEAPLLSRPKKDKAPVALLFPDDLVTVHQGLPAMDWQAPFDGVLLRRNGPMVEVRRAAGERALFAFQRDLGPSLQVPAARWICDQLAGQADPEACAKGLRRVRTADGAVAGYLPVGPSCCRVVLVRDGRVSAIALDGLIGARALTIAGKTVLAATTRWVRADGNWTGGKLETVSLTGERPAVVGSIPLDAVDARDPVLVVQRLGSLEIRGAELRFVGVERSVVRDTAAERSSRSVDERYRIGPGGQVSAEPVGSSTPPRDTR